MRWAGLKVSCTSCPLRAAVMFWADSEERGGEGRVGNVLSTLWVFVVCGSPHQTFMGGTLAD